MFHGDCLDSRIVQFCPASTETINRSYLSLASYGRNSYHSHGTSSLSFVWCGQGRAEVGNVGVVTVVIIHMTLAHSLLCGVARDVLK